MSDYDADIEDFENKKYDPPNYDADVEDFEDETEPQEYYVSMRHQLRPVRIIDLTGEPVKPDNFARSY